MIICAFENSPSIPSFLVTKIVYIGYGQLKKMTPFPFTFPNGEMMSIVFKLPTWELQIKTPVVIFLYIWKNI
jgi:hypothetical protein